MLISTEIDSLNRFTGGEEKSVELVAKAGFDAWDFSLLNMARPDWERGCVFQTDHPLRGPHYAEFAKNLRRIGEDNGIFCNQSHAPFPVNMPEVKSYLKRALECTAIAGGKICVIHPDNNKSPEENADFYSSLIPFAKEVGVRIAAENMWNWKDNTYTSVTSAACSDEKSFLAHLNAVNDDYLVACLDIGHAEMQGLNTSAVKMINALGDKLQALHIHDNDKVSDSHQLPFTMMIDFHAIVKALKENNYKGIFTLEALSYPGTKPDIKECLSDMKTVARRLANEFESL